MEDCDIEEPERFETEPEVDGDECPECGDLDCGFCELCAENECCCECDDSGDGDDEEFPDEDDMRDECDEAAGI